ncbi:hypothetical protein ACFQT0_20970 [Hymenobacter humi]|uniref:Uncharacterized protein n=1 Tax=Hymenobacter humi TaxID=1411620 RepID=A0ABW2U7T2_9BACT
MSVARLVSKFTRSKFIQPLVRFTLSTCSPDCRKVYSRFSVELMPTFWVVPLASFSSMGRPVS